MSPSRSRSSLSFAAMPASAALTCASCSAWSRSNVRQCIPFDVQPLPFRMPGSQPRRLRSLSARRVALSSPASVGQVVAPLQAPVRYRTSTDPWQPPRPPCSHPRNDKAHHDGRACAGILVAWGGIEPSAIPTQSASRRRPSREVTAEVTAFPQGNLQDLHHPAHKSQTHDECSRPTTRGR